MNMKVAGCAFVVLLAVLAGCSDRGSGAVDTVASKPVVYTVNYPLAYFAERIGGELIEVRFPVPAAADPAFWKPTTAEILAFQRADLILLNGASYAKWVGRSSLPPSKLVDTSARFRDRYIQVKDAITHSHGPGGKHSHSGTAFTTWLDPAQAALQAQAAAKAIARLLPGKEAAVERNFTALRSDLGALGDALRAAGSGYGGAPLLASHPVYQYLARSCGLNLRSLHWEPSEQPSPEQWRKLDGLLRKHPAKWMIWEAPPAAGVAAELERRGVGVVVFYPCGNRPASGDYLSVMKGNIARLRPALR